MSQLLGDSVIQDWLDQAKRKFPQGEVAMSESLAPHAHVITLGTQLLMAKRMLKEEVEKAFREPFTFTKPEIVDKRWAKSRARRVAEEEEG